MEGVKKYKTFIKNTIILCLVYGLSIETLCTQEYNFEQLRSRVTNSKNINLTDVKTMDAWVLSQSPDGSWGDMQYGKTTLTNALTNNHLHRLWHLAAACTTTNHKRYDNLDYKTAIKKGLKFWYDSKSVDANWWFNKIYFPQRLGEILIYMRVFDGFIPQKAAKGIDEPEILSLFTPTEIKDITQHSTGANAIDIALHYVYRGLLTENGKLLEDTKNKLESVLTDNIKADMVYQDHGPQIMIASYGLVFCEGLIRLASYLANSPAAFNTKSENFSKVIYFIKETQVSSTRGRSWDYSVLGRSVSRPNAMYVNMEYLQTLADFVDTKNAEIYLDALERLKGNAPPSYKIREFNKHYWVSDYTQHARSGYLFTVRNTSTRTAEGETGNGENLKANYLSYGANFMAIDGDEYINIMPVWDWSMIPGTTFPYIKTFPKRSTWGSNFGNTTFVGGVSDGNYGVSVLNLDEANLTAKKSWFFFDDEIVCLGTSIVDNSGRNVRTTINQSWMRSPSFYCKIGKNKETKVDLSSTVYKHSNLKYIRNGKFGYYFPEKNHVKYSMQTKAGGWRTINKVEDSIKIEKGNVFTLWIDHGENPDNETYSYIVVPNIDSKKKAQRYNMNAIQIVENTASIQAVYHNKLHILQAVYYQAGTVHIDGLSITANRPCMLMFKQGGVVTVSNPSQTYSNVLINIKYRDNTYSKIIELPTGNNKEGASTSVDFQIPKK
ncbi:hypothetical protein J1D01_16770 [Seonamhaeicola sp. NFXS20]|uniref:polysaccharide lyase family 8 super-sandwich domain-containing protein n=1 Tax=Seonamhaeicola sp. NFXS20 TaxID=2816959 RepID=UPI003B8CB9DB